MVQPLLAAQLMGQICAHDLVPSSTDKKGVISAARLVLPAILRKAGDSKSADVRSGAFDKKVDASGLDTSEYNRRCPTARGPIQVELNID